MDMKRISRNTLNGSLMTEHRREHLIRKADYIFRKVNSDFYRLEDSILTTKEFYSSEEVLELLNKENRSILIIGEKNWISNF